MTKVGHVTLLPQNDTTNGWSAVLPPRRPKQPLSREISVDWAIVGAGFAGLAAARRVAERRPQDQIVVIEAGAAGEGAQGRNAGFAIDLPHNLSASFSELESAERHKRLYRAAIAHLQSVVETHSVACDWRRDGRYHAAVSQRGVDGVLKPLASELARSGESYEWLDRKALADVIGTDYYAAALFTPGGVLVNPAALSRGLADTLPPNVTLYETTPVVDFAPGAPTRLTTPHGRVNARKVVLAVNGFADRFGLFKHRLLSFAAHASLTRPLTEDEQRRLGGDWAERPIGASLRPTLFPASRCVAPSTTASSFVRTCASVPDCARLTKSVAASPKITSDCSTGATPTYRTSRSAAPGPATSACRATARPALAKRRRTFSSPSARTRSA